MRNIMMAAMAMGFVALTACGGGSSEGGAAPAPAPAATEAPAAEGGEAAAEGGEAAAEGGEAAAEGGEAAAEGGEAAAEGGDAEEVICCEFGGAKGTATRAKCEEYKGTIHPRSDCP